MPDKFQNKFSDKTLLAKATLTAPSDGTYNVIRVHRNGFVEEVWANKRVAASGGGAVLTVGFSGNGESADPDGFIDAVHGAATATGLVKASGDTQPASQGKYFDSGSGVITVTVDDAGGTPGTVDIFVRITKIH